MNTSIAKFLIALTGAAAAAAASAQTTNVVFGTDFEGSGVNDNYLSSYGYAYAGSDSGTAAVSFSGGGITAGVGLTNSSGVPGYPDFTMLATDANYIGSHAYTYAGVSLDVLFGPPLNPIAPMANLDDVIVSFDAVVGGLLPGQTNTILAFGPAATDGHLDFTTGGTTTFRFLVSGLTVSSNYTHVEVPLSAFTLNQGNASDLTNPAVLSAIDGFTVDLRDAQEVGTIGVNRSPIFGFDNDNSVIIDNVYLRQVTGAGPPPPKYENLIWQVNFDDLQPGNTYGFTFRDGANSATTTVTTNATAGVGGSAALQVTANLSSWSSSPPVSFSGFGPGVGHGIPYTLHNTNKSAYRVYWTAKAGGLLDGITSASGNASIQFLVPPGTLTPSNAAEAIVLELVPNITLSSNFTSFVFDGSAAPIGIFNGGSQAMFNQYVSQVNLVQVQAQYNGSPNIGTVFGYDADNTMTVDNVKVVELVEGIGPLSIVDTNGQIKVYWSDPANNDGTAKLQSSANVAGPYTDVTGAASAAAASPYTVPPGSPQLFFRAKWVP